MLGDARLGPVTARSQHPQPPADRAETDTAGSKIVSGWFGTAA